LKKAKRPLILLGEGALNGRPLGAEVMALAAGIAKDCGALGGDWNGFGVLHNAAGRMGGLDIGFVPGPGGLGRGDQFEAARQKNLDVLFLLGVDDFDIRGLGGAFVVYIGTHGDVGAHRADIILPGAAYTEKNATYVNLEGRVQRTSRAVFPPGEGREDWSIFRALSGRLNAPVPYDTLGQLREKMIADHPHLGRVNEILTGDAKDVEKLAVGVAKPANLGLGSPIHDFYLTNPIARASAVMAQCSKARTGLAEAAE